MIDLAALYQALAGEQPPPVDDGRVQMVQNDNNGVWRPLVENKTLQQLRLEDALRPNTMRRIEQRRLVRPGPSNDDGGFFK